MVGSLGICWHIAIDISVKTFIFVHILLIAYDAELQEGVQFDKWWIDNNVKIIISFCKSCVKKE